MQDPQSNSTIPLLLFHGLLSSPQEFGLISHTLRGHGLAYEAVTVPGYTLASDHKSPDWRQWRDAAIAVVESRLEPRQPVVLGGLCMGGVLAAAVALELRCRVAGLVLISPSFTYDGWGLQPIRHLRHLGYWTGLDRFFSVAEREPYGIKNPKMRKWVKRELEQRIQSAVGPARVPLRALREGERMTADVRARLDQLDGPLMMIHAREDEITRLDSVQRLFDALPIRDKELAILENSYHMVTVDNDRHQVASHLAGFVKRLGPAPLAEPALDDGPAARALPRQASISTITPRCSSTEDEMNTLNELKQLIQDKFDIDVATLKDDAPLADYGIDSLSLAELLFSVEDRFDIDFADHRQDINTLTSLAALIDELRALHPA